MTTCQTHMALLSLRTGNSSAQHSESKKCFQKPFQFWLSGYLTWATTTEAQVYLPPAVGSFQQINVNSTLFSKDPIKVIKLCLMDAYKSVTNIFKPW